MPPATEVTRIYRKLAAWPARLGIRLEQDATPVERGQAIADVLPEFGPEIDRIVDGYGAERYGDVSQPAGEAVRAWKAVRLPLYRAGLTRLLDLIFARNDN
jgi:hypothetical protein